jgi:hypothetical protein
MPCVNKITAPKLELKSVVWSCCPSVISHSLRKLGTVALEQVVVAGNWAEIESSSNFEGPAHPPPHVTAAS